MLGSCQGNLGLLMSSDFFSTLLTCFGFLKFLNNRKRFGIASLQRRSVKPERTTIKPHRPSVIFEIEMNRFERSQLFSRVAPCINDVRISQGPVVSPNGDSIGPYFET